MFFPLFVEVANRPCLVVGGGRVAARKVAILRSFEARVTVVAPQISDEISAISDCRIVERRFCRDDLAEQSLVVAATDDAALNSEISELCRGRGLPVNVVDDPSQSTFIFPAMCQKGDIVAAVSSGGKCPVAAQIVRDRISQALTDDFLSAVAELGARREAIKKKMPDTRQRRVFYQNALRRFQS